MDDKMIFGLFLLGATILGIIVVAGISNKRGR